MNFFFLLLMLDQLSHHKPKATRNETKRNEAKRNETKERTKQQATKITKAQE
jgi:hypothetical protein